MPFSLQMQGRWDPCNLAHIQAMHTAFQTPGTRMAFLIPATPTAELGPTS